MNHRHSMFIEMTIVLLISFEVIVEMHALGWISLPGHPLRASTAPAGVHSADAPVEEVPAPLRRRHSAHQPVSERPDMSS
jgi:hypothetical protein